MDTDAYDTIQREREIMREWLIMEKENNKGGAGPSLRGDNL